MKSNSLMDNSRRLSLAWFTFAVASLGFSTLFALLLIASRTPGIGGLLPDHHFFDNALVLHVNLSVIVWILAAGSALHALVTPARALNLGWFALGTGVVGAVLMALGPLPDDVKAIKSNYIPVLFSWPFIAGLSLFGIAAGLMAFRTILLLRPWQGPIEQRPVTIAAYGAAWGVLLAILSGAWSYVLTPQSLQATAYFEQLFWAPGHILQLGNMLLMLMAWLWLANNWELVGDDSAKWTKIVLFLGVTPLVVVPILLWVYPPATPEFKSGFTELMRWGTWLAALPLGAMIFWRLRKHGDILPSEHSGLKLSMILFFFGIVIGALITADNVMVPAHYHGTVGAVTLALMAVCFHQLPRWGFSTVGETYTRWQLRLYGFGTLIMALGLAVSGWMGVGRKLPGNLQVLTEPGALEHSGRVIAMSFAGLGGSMAVIGSALFVIGVLKVLLQKQQEQSSRKQKGILASLALGCIIVQVGALLGTFTQTKQVSSAKTDGTSWLTPHRISPDAHIQQAEKQALDKRFQQAVTMLQAKQYDYAIAALQEVLVIRPNMPEAHVNMGYALLGLKQFDQAALAFDRATVLRPSQANAYFGMAEALYEKGDLEGALGAMRTYVHLVPKEDPFLRKANAAIWEWEAELQQKKAAKKP